MTMWFARLERALRLLGDRRGGTAVIFALVTPALALLGCGAIDIASVNSDRAAMQDAADATALAMAKQLGVATAAGIAARAQAYAAGQLGPIAANDGVSVTATVGANNNSVNVAITGHRNSFFGNLVPPGGWQMSVQATASSLGELPLCVLSTGTGGANNIQLQGSSDMTAGNCLVQSNQNIAADNGASLTAGLTQAVGTASGPITPAPQSGAPAIADPFASVPLDASALGSLVCPVTNVLANLGAGAHTIGPPLLGAPLCGDVTIGANTSVTLEPGVYYFENGTLNLESNSALAGSDVVLIFGDNASFNFKDNSLITLSGRQSGTYAGFVIMTGRNNTSTFTISSNNAKQLEGAIYVPSATLEVTGNGNTVANQSAWTVVVAQALQLQGNPNLVINANYASSNVPVPGGVGDNYASGKVSLTR
jgi:Flp pilus assembly protein TadG